MLTIPPGRTSGALNLLSDHDRQALSALTPEWSMMPTSFRPNHDCSRLELLGFIEARMISGGWAMRLTRAGYEARGDRFV